MGGGGSTGTYGRPRKSLLLPLKAEHQSGPQHTVEVMQFAAADICHVGVTKGSPT